MKFAHALLLVASVLHRSDAQMSSQQPAYVGTDAAGDNLELRSPTGTVISLSSQSFYSHICVPAPAGATLFTLFLISPAGGTTLL